MLKFGLGYVFFDLLYEIDEFNQADWKYLRSVRFLSLKKAKTKKKQILNQAKEKQKKEQ